jgi:4-amino-4-deoxychorismate lyase
MAIVINGTLTPPDRATISIFDRGFQYGDGLFETVAIVNGQPLFWEEHLRRMSTGASVLGIPMPHATAWLEDMRSAIDARKAREVLKLMLTRGVGGRGYATPLPQLPTRIAYTSSWPTYPSEYWTRGIDVVTCHTAQLGGSMFATVKSLNRINQVLARAELPEDVPEGLLLDTSGVVREGTFTNVVWIRDGRAATPTLTDVGIPGVMRGATVVALQDRGISCDAVEAAPRTIADADECFVCNSLIGLWPVRSIDGRALKQSPGPVTVELLGWVRSIGLAPG